MTDYNEKKCIELIERLGSEHCLDGKDYEFLISNRNDVIITYAGKIADKLRKEIYGNQIFIRGLIEISNYCKNDCLYCGIRRSNPTCERYRLTEEQILSCCENGYALGFRTFVLQGGEDNSFTDDKLCSIISKIKNSYPDCAVTLSLGEKAKESYQAYFDCGADRYLLRHETADNEHYSLLHTKEQSFENRMRCLYDLRDIGYQVGCGFMVESPYQTDEMLAEDLLFIQSFQPVMCGIGPFIPHKATPLSSFSQGSVEKTVFLLSLIRLIKPNILLPATTALGTISKYGREKGILAGANVIMPNLSPIDSRKKYELYNNKLCTDEEASENIRKLKKQMEKIGFEIVTSKGDIIQNKEFNRKEEI